MRGGRRLAAGAGLAIALVACSRSAASGHGEAGAASLLADQPRHLILGALNPLLRPYLRPLHDRFGGESEEPLLVQRLDLAAGRRALLVMDLREQRPLLLLTDHDRLVRATPVPPSGAPFTHAALAPRPDGGVAVFGCAPQAPAVSASMWSADGAPLSDVRAATAAECDALSAVYGPGLGWIVAFAAGQGLIRAQLLNDDGRPAWGDRGAPVGAPNGVGAVTVVPDTPSTWVVLQRERRDDVEDLVAFRYDDHARPLWPGPAHIGVLGRVSSHDRIEARLVRDGAVRVELPEGLRGTSAHAAEISADGSVRRLAR